MNTGCVYNSQLSMGVVIQVPTGNNIAVTLDNNYDVMVYDITQNQITFFTNANQIILANPDQYIIAVLNPESITVVNPNLNWIPSAPPSGYNGWQFVITEPSVNESQNSQGTYTIDVNGINLYFNPNVQSTYSVGYGNETAVLTNTLYTLSSLLNQLTFYFTLQQAQEINEVAQEEVICGTLIGSPDKIVFTPPSSGVQSSQSTQASAQPFSYGILFIPSVPPLPPPPPSKPSINKDLVTAGVIGALLTAGAIVSRKAK